MNPLEVLQAYHRKNSEYGSQTDGLSDDVTSLSGYKGMYQLVLILSGPLIKTPVKEGAFPKNAVMPVNFLGT